MPLWGNTNNSANSVKYAALQVHVTANSQNQTYLYNNTTVGAWKNYNASGTVDGISAAIGQFTVNAATMASNRTNSLPRAQHAGWQLKTQFTGPVTGVAVVAGGSGYSNTDTVNVLPPSGSINTVNATASVTTNATGGIVSLSLTNTGSGFVSTSINSGTTPASFKFANSTGGNSAGSSANLTVTVGGRAGRIQYETLATLANTVNM